MNQFSSLNDPLVLGRLLWPHVRFYDKQIDMIYSVRDAKETYVVAGNQLGKDFVSGFICLTFFLAPQCYFPVDYVRQIERMNRPTPGIPDYIAHQRRVVTTSVKDEHLAILWGEISRFYQTSQIPLNQYLSMVHHEIRFREEANLEGKNVMSYLIGGTSKSGEGMSGHHAPYTLAVGDEASGLVDEVRNQFMRWAKRMLFFGNPNPTNNFFKQQYRMGDLQVAA